MVGRESEKRDDSDRKVRREKSEKEREEIGIGKWEGRRLGG